jgi:hypothetical protein
MRAVREWMGREKQPVRELVKLFFRRFLENGLICLDGDTKPALVNILALLAAPGIFLPVLELLAYAAAYQRPFYVRDMASIPEKALYLCFSMTALGIATVLEWDTLVPDRRDYAVLRPLPLRPGTILAAKIAAVAGFWGILTLVINAFAHAGPGHRLSRAGGAGWKRIHLPGDSLGAGAADERAGMAGVPAGAGSCALRH